MTFAVTLTGGDGAQQHPGKHLEAENTLPLLPEHYRQKPGGYTQTFSILVSFSFFKKRLVWWEFFVVFSFLLKETSKLRNYFFPLKGMILFK